MGCIQTTHSKGETEQSINGNFTNLNEVKAATEIDPRLPLNVRQIFKLKQSWKGIKRKSTEAGVDMFIR